MDCPRCRRTLVDEGICHSCTDCGGTFFSSKQATDYFMLGESPETEDSGVLEFNREASLPCPDCLTTMDKVSLGDHLLLDTCARCHGFFFDAGESLSLRSRLAHRLAGPRLRCALRQMISFSLGGPYR